MHNIDFNILDNFSFECIYNEHSTYGHAIYESIDSKSFSCPENILISISKYTGNELSKKLSGKIKIIIVILDFGVFFAKSLTRDIVLSPLLFKLSRLINET